MEDRLGSPESTHTSKKDDLLPSVGPTRSKDPFPHKLLFTHSVNVNIQFGILAPLKKIDTNTGPSRPMSHYGRLVDEGSVKNSRSGF